MVIRRGEIWWADLPEPIGSAPGYRRPVLVIQSDEFNRSLINTVVIAAITTNMRIARAAGNVAVTPKQSGLTKDSVINVSQLFSLDKSRLTEFVGTLSESKMEQVSKGLRLVLSI